MSVSTHNPEPVALKCGCGVKKQVTLKRYEVMHCSCGKGWWPLRPMRGGPLRMFAHPGPNLTAAELEAKEAANAH